MQLEINHPDELAAAIPAILEGLANRRKIALYGEMGAGKTTLVKAFCRHLGVEGATGSPTYSLVNQYTYKNSDGSPAYIHHLDLYRLKNTAEAFDIGLEDLLYDPWYCVIEWPEIVESMFPEQTAKIKVEIIGETSRRILIL